MQKEFKDPSIISLMKGKITKVTDGDTYTLTTPENQEFTLRLWNFDTPEKTQDLGMEITKHVTKLLLNRSVEFEFIKIGNYERNIGRVFVYEKYNEKGNKRIDIALHLAFQGYGYTSSKTPDDPYVIRQKEAIYNKRGVWANDNAILPSDYRKQKKEGQSQSKSIQPNPKQKNKDFKTKKRNHKKKGLFD